MKVSPSKFAPYFFPRFTFLWVNFPQDNFSSGTMICNFPNKAWFTQATSDRLRSRVMLHFEVVQLDWEATVKKSVLPDDNFKFVVMKL